MELIDAHCHLNAKEFDQDRAAVVEAAEQAGLVAAIDSGEGLEENQKSLEISQLYNIVKSSFGFHPVNLSMESALTVIAQIRENSEKIVAIGEVGLDYWHVKEEPEREKQRGIFVQLIDLAVELKKPLIIHSRSAGKYALELLKEHNAAKVCMHAFDGSAANAQPGIGLGYYFSIPASIVRSEQKQKLVQNVPLENLMLESDSPVLGPTKLERNEPKNVVVAVEKIAELKQVDVEEVARVTTGNAREFFGD